MRATVERAARLAWWVLVLEVRLYVALVQWVLRRRPGVGPGVEPVGYAQLVTPVMGLWIFASALEVPLVHVITPWPGVRLALLALSVWGLVWMLGMLGSLRVRPHLAGADTFTVRYGVFATVVLSWDDVASVHKREQDWPSSVRVTQWSEDGAEVAVAVSGRTNVTLELRRPVVVRPGHGEARPVTRVSLWADEPGDLVRLTRRRSGLPR